MLCRYNDVPKGVFLEKLSCSVKKFQTSWKFEPSLRENNAPVMLCYVMWNLFTVSSLQFCNDGAIASLEANQNRPKTTNDVKK